ncbi:N-acetylmuramoyl-L-alanine amidase [Streptomyces sp. TRM68367]|nr:N-acetylmuramoyl-L-alanine amidase [Streptomyces sp. TRM68367]
MTATGGTSSSYVTVYPDGATRPTASNLNFSAGETIPNLVVVPVVNGKVDFYNNAGSVNLIADITGYYTGS